MTEARERALRAVIIDDEPAARRLLQELLGEHPGVEVVAEHRNGREALEWLAENRADLLFLDVQMPGMTGFELLEALELCGERSDPAVIFVTAHDEYAVRAFEAEAWDYLLKPFDGERLRQSLARVRRRLAAPPPSPARPLERLAVPHGRGWVTIRLREVLFIQAESNYVRFHLPGASHLARTSLTRLESRLDRELFVRVHRSAIVNVEQIERLESRGHGDMALTLRGGREITLSRRYRGRLERVLESLS